MEKCLMIKTKDNRKFFTHVDNLPQLIEFSKTFEAEMSVVKIVKGEILSLEALAPAICNTQYTSSEEPLYKILKIKAFENSSNRTKAREKASKIQNYIITKFLKGKIVALQEIQHHFAKHDLTLSCICNHISKAKRQLISKGHHIIKIGAGKYKIS